MKTFFGHIQFNIDGANTGFYRDLFTFLGWRTLHEGNGMLGVGAADGGSVWFTAEGNGVANDFDGTGLNHFAIGASSQADVDDAAEYLESKGVERLFETPRHRPEFGMGEGQTYYQVMFRSPDGILWEVVYIGPVAA